MPLNDWRKLGLFVVLMLLLSLADARLALWLTGGLIAVVVIGNADKFAALAKRVNG
ncbi:MAG: hypothetical protein ACTHMP_09320 [Thermomicrobiales bacterium]